ncbi:unnamed protein product [Nesidiocoris tenuis]|uniref:Uncharacterized protein n=1 Tax=Nesidiocoris tenuis TaxID=355587 RepID=A0A6H5G3C1_9HEMI|nr:unnamed protein product [Nesidiocoris tenuis]
MRWNFQLKLRFLENSTSPAQEQLLFDEKSWTIYTNHGPSERTARVNKTQYRPEIPKRSNWKDAIIRWDFNSNLDPGYPTAPTPVVRLRYAVREDMEPTQSPDPDRPCPRFIADSAGNNSTTAFLCLARRGKISVERITSVGDGASGDVKHDFGFQLLHMKVDSTSMLLRFHVCITLAEPRCRWERISSVNNDELHSRETAFEKGAEYCGLRCTKSIPGRRQSGFSGLWIPYRLPNAIPENLNRRFQNVEILLQPRGDGFVQQRL